jgi:hypothetical protein
VRQPCRCRVACRGDLRQPDLVSPEG